MIEVLSKESHLTNGQKIVKAYRFKGLKGGALIGFFIGLLLVTQSFEPGTFDIKKVLTWTAITTTLFALSGWLLYGGTSGFTGYNESSDSSGSSDSGGD
ncbi:hypothetical protein ACU6U9_04260 [Pseudomonas sp. HK3]|jgi:hypothetical protein